MRILCFGDSLTAGYTSSGKYTPYANYLKDLLSSNGNAKRIDDSNSSSSSSSSSDDSEDKSCHLVDHIGNSGWTTLEMVLGSEDVECIDCFDEVHNGLAYRLQLEESKGSPYDYVMILAGTNDIGSMIPINKVVANVESLVDTCLSMSVKVGLILGRIATY